MRNPGSQERETAIKNLEDIRFAVVRLQPMAMDQALGLLLKAATTTPEPKRVIAAQVSLFLVSCLPYLR
jgi:hypothetical protein